MMARECSILDYVLPLTVFAIPFGAYSIETPLVNLSPPNILIFLTFGALAIQYRRQSLELTRPQVVVMLLFSLLAVQQALTTLVHGGSPRRLITYFGYLLFTWAVIMYIEDSRDMQRLLAAGFLTAVVISLFTIVHILTYPEGLSFAADYLFGPGRKVAGYTIPFKQSLGIKTSYGAFGMYTMMATPYFAYLSLRRRSVSLAIGVIVVLLAAFMSQSRSTWVATAIAMSIVTLGYMLWSENRWVRYAGIAGGVIGVVSVPVVARILISVNPSTFDSRITQYREGLDIILTNPFFGVGFGNLDQYYTGTAQIHSAFVNLTVRTGIVALFLVSLIWLISIVYLSTGLTSSSQRFSFAVGVYASLAAMLIESNLQPGFTKATWVILAIGLSVYGVSAFGGEEESGLDSSDVVS